MEDIQEQSEILGPQVETTDFTSWHSWPVAFPKIKTFFQVFSVMQIALDGTENMQLVDCIDIGK